MKKLTKIIPLTLLAVLLLLLGLFWFLKSESGQNYITKQIDSYLNQKLGTKVSIGKIRYDFPNWIQIENLIIEDKNKVELINSKKFYASISMLDILDNKLTISNL